MENRQEFSRRYQRWIDSFALNPELAEIAWQRIANELELSQGQAAPKPPDRRNRIRIEGREKLK